MTTPNQPETLTELLRTLERSGELRSLARECGLSVRELRRRLAIWRRELIDTDDDLEDMSAQPSEGTSKTSKPKAAKAPAKANL